MTAHCIVLTIAENGGFVLTRIPLALLTVPMQVDGAYSNVEDMIEGLAKVLVDVEEAGENLAHSERALVLHRAPKIPVTPMFSDEALRAMQEEMEKSHRRDMGFTSAGVDTKEGGYFTNSPVPEGDNFKAVQVHSAGEKLPLEPHRPVSMPRARIKQAHEQPGDDN